ncbi:MAG TPA: [protein-PII] uridylyltransferase, partial [Nocardioidaceae bacterium]|nr:[protein-PII] uridylyltransferase [Nocardioidaceae bacterium]
MTRLPSDPAQRLRAPRAVRPSPLPDERGPRSDHRDARLRGLLERAVPEHSGIALVAVGGYGRRELSPQSDLDVVLLHAPDRQDVAEIAERVWYPLWDDGVRLDHSVRTLDQMEAAADADLRTFLGLLDARHVAGDAALTLQLRSHVLARWRADARRRIPELEAQGRARAERAGDLAYAAVPDLKESRGGLRDGVALRALVASWLVDVPHAELERCRRELLCVRDALHLVTGRPGDRLPPEVTAEVAGLLGIEDATTLQRWVRALGRRMTHLSAFTWHQVNDTLATPRRRAGTRRPAMVPLAPGVARSGAEVVLEHRARPERDPSLMLRAAAEAAQRGLLLAPSTAVRLSRQGAPLPEPWSRPARELFVRLLGAGPPLLPVWQTLEEVDALGGLLPEWDGIRLLPSSAPVHRFTVDRHSVQTCVEAGSMLRRVDRPDLLLVAALLHDIGKGRGGDHSERGASLARGIALRWGFPARDADVVAGLVRHHLLLPHTATRRDLEDPATVRLVAERVPSPRLLDLLAALTEADARATGPAAWSAWRRGLVRELVARTRATLVDSPVAPVGEVWPDVAVGRAWVGLEDADRAGTAEGGEAGRVLVVGAPDELGLLATVSAAIAVSGLHVRSARAGVSAGNGWSRWEVAEGDVDTARVRQRLLGVLDGTLSTDRLRPPAGRPPPEVAVRPDDSTRATVLEVRDSDWTGLLHAVCSCLAGLGVEVRSAHVETLGPQAVDVFYVGEPAGGPLSAARAAATVE